jgi:hypothetical protein
MLSRFGIFAVLFSALVAFHGDIRADAVVVTVTGDIGPTNRGPFDSFYDAFFGYHDVSFEKAYAFTRDDLVGLGMQETTLKYPEWPDSITFRGPKMGVLLDKVEALGGKVSVQALDGYAAEFDLESLRNGPFILAIERDGRPLSTGGRGPAWLVFPPGNWDKQTEGTDEGLVWAVFHIKIE